MKTILNDSVLYPLVLSIFFISILSSCATTNGYKQGRTQDGVEYGLASWYGKDFHGRPTASGEIYDMYGLSAAHRSLPLGTRLKVKNLNNSREVEIVVNDRGPFVDGRIIDLSYGAAKRLDMVDEGVVPVRIEVIGRDDGYVRKVKVEGDGAEGFTIQVGSFSDRANAERLKTVLGWRYSDVYISDVVIDGNIHYRVRIGMYKDKDSAVRAAQRLADEGYPVWVTGRSRE